jgi:serine/threonine protein phosphatase PrpC
MQQQRLAYGWRTDRGLVREQNEDSVAVSPDLGLLIVADGIGGANAGDVASRTAAEVITDQFRSHSPTVASQEDARLLAEDAVMAANKAVWTMAQRTPVYAGMGTTVVLGFVGLGWMVFAHVGDSRLYRLRDAKLEQLTKDHSFIQEVVDQGFFPSLADAQRYGVKENILTRGLGTSPQVAVDSGVVELQPNDLFLFCTDGLTGMVADDVLTRVLVNDGEDLDNLASILIDLACARGGLDNVTVALLRVY